MTIKNKQQADIYNLNAAQAGIWLGQQILPEACVYGAAEYLPLGPSIDIERFHTAFKQLQSSADIFRLSLVPNNLAATEGELPVLQRIEHSDIAQTLTYKQFGSLSLATQWMKNDIAKNSLYQPEHALYRCSLIQYLKDGENHWLFYMAIHHMICDGYGFNLLFKHLCALYNGSQNTIKATQISTLAPVIAEDNRYRQSSSFKKDAQFWQQQLQNLPQPKPLTSTAQSPSISLDHVVASQALSVDLNQLSIGDSSTAQAHSHWVDTCLALSLIWRFQKTGERDICLGLPVMNRYGSVSARTPAMAMNIIPLRIKIDSDDTLISLQKKARSNINAAQRHQRYRYEDIRQSRSDKHPLFATVVNIQPYFEPLSINQYVTETCAISSGPVDDLSLTLSLIHI